MAAQEESDEWVLWQHETGKGINWKESAQVLTCFGAALQDLDLPVLSQVFTVRGQATPNSKKEFSLFRAGVLPEWEDPRNKTGGSLFIRTHIPAPGLDLVWRNLVDIARKSTLPINGIRACDKSKGLAGTYAIEIWLNTTQAKAVARMRQVAADIFHYDIPEEWRNKRLPKIHWKPFETKSSGKTSKEKQNKRMEQEKEQAAVITTGPYRPIKWSAEPSAQRPKYLGPTWRKRSEKNSH